MLAFAALCLSPVAAVAQGQAAGRLVVKVSGLPPGAAARAVVRGPGGFRQALAHSQTFSGVAPGTYSVSIASVTLSRPLRQVPAGSEAFPVRRRIRVHLRPGGKAVAPVAYGTIRSAGVVTLASPVVAVVGDPEDPKGVVVTAKAGAGIAAGSIVAQAPGQVLPRGLFDRVTGTSSHHGHETLALTPASLWEAFPALDLETTVPLGESVTPPGAAQGSGLSAIDLGLGGDVIQKKLAASCGAPPSGWSLKPSGSIQPSLTVEIHRHYLVVPYGELKLGLKGSLGLDATLPEGVHCGFSVSGPGIEGVVPVAGVPVPVEGGVDFSVSLQSAGSIQVKAKVSVDATGGMSFDGASVKPIADLTPTASGSVTGSGGEIDLVPDFQVGIGALDGNAHVGISPGLAAKATASGCEFDLKGSVGAGIDAAGWHPSINSPSLTKTLYKCPALPAGGGAKPPVVSTPGGGSTSGNWTIESVPAPQNSALYGVSCTTGGFCVAVGNTESGALIERRGPGGWVSESGAAVSGTERPELYGVSCIAPTSCTAVGWQWGGATEVPLIEHWNGLGWSVQPGPPVPGEDTRLLGVSCVDESWCVAVGEGDYSDGDSVEILERWDGSSWALESIPSPAGSDARALSGVDCVSRAFCEVVGGYDNDQGILTGHAYADSWNGSGWALQTVNAHPGNQFSGLAGVDCVSSAYCAAVGYWDAGLGSYGQPMAVGWNGASWSDQPLPGLAPGQVGGETPGVSCASPSACIAVGSAGGEADESVVADRWDGSSWTGMATPAVPGAVYAELEAVSCVSATSCVGVGRSWSSQTGPLQPLVEAYSG